MSVKLDVKLTTHLHQVLRLRTDRAIQQIPDMSSSHDARVNAREYFTLLHFYFLMKMCVSVTIATLIHSFSLNYHLLPNRMHFNSFSSKGTHSSHTV
jgi:hypothetical protein